MNEKRLVQRFMDYASCGSESRDEREFCLLLEGELTRMGLPPVKQEEAGRQSGSNGWNLYARLDGVGRPVLLCAHMDTVSPGKGVKPVLADGVIRSDGSTVLGGDDKSGIAAALEAVESILESGHAHRPVELLFTVCEEIGMQGAKYADYAMIASEEAIVLDGGRVGTIVNRSPAQMALHFDIAGKGAHAALSPEEGVHALKAAARAIDRIPCGRIGEDSVVNVANLLAPGASNVVSERASFDAEVRSYSRETMRRLADEMKAVVEGACDEYGASCTASESLLSAGLYVPEDSALIHGLTAAVTQCGVTPAVEGVFGGCDANRLFDNGIQAVDTGTGMTDIHSCTESLRVADLCKITEILETFLTAVPQP